MNSPAAFSPVTAREALWQLQAERRTVELVYYADTLLWVYKDDWLYNRVPEKHRDLDPLRFQLPTYDAPAGPEVTVLEHVLRHEDSPTVVDVGCNYGIQTIRMLRTARKLGKSIRPQLFDPGIAGKLAVLNLKLNGFEEFDYYNVAISDTDGYVSLFIVEGQSQDNKIINSKPEAMKLPVQSLRLNSFFQRLDRESLCFMKIDTQGAEYEVFNGFDDPRWRRRFAAIIEFFPNGLATRVPPRKFLTSLCQEFIVYDLGAHHKYATQVDGNTVEGVMLRLNEIKPPFTDLLVLSRDLPALDHLMAQLDGLQPSKPPR